MDNSDNITWAESRGKTNAQAKTSSALGLGQFVKGTWLDMIRRYRPDLAQGKSDAEILELRKDADISKEMTRRYAQENEAKLRQAGIPVTPGSTYLMHFAGPSGGIALMNADPNTPVESILSGQAIKANPFLQGKTASWVIAWANKKMADAAKSSVTPQPAQPIPYVAQTQVLDPAFGATSWPPIPASPNVLSPKALRPFAGAPRVVSNPFVDGTVRARQTLDDALTAPRAPLSVFSDRFGGWDDLGGASGPTRSGGSNDLGQAGDGSNPGAGGEPFAQTGVDPSESSQPMPPFASSSNGMTSSIRRLGSRIPGAQGLVPQQAQTLSGSVGGVPSFLPVWRPPEALLAPDRNQSLRDLVQPLPFNQAKLPPRDASGGIPGLLMQLGAFDPSQPNDPPAGGLLRLLQDYMRNNPDSSSAL